MIHPVPDRPQEKVELLDVDDTFPQTVADKRPQPSKSSFTFWAVSLGVSGLLFAALALPDLMGTLCACSKEVAAKNGVGTINRAQQAYHFERGTFFSTLSTVNLSENNELGVVVYSHHYEFSVRKVGGVAYSYAMPINPLQDETRHYFGAVFFDREHGYSSIVCQGDTISELPPSEPRLANGSLVCGPDTSVLRY